MTEKVRNNGEKPTVGVVSLGCDKNRVDTENVLASLEAAGYRIVQNAGEADVLMVNTCAFITPAVRESIDTVLELAAEKAGRENVKLMVLGCFTERFAEETASELPEVDAFVGINCYHRIAEITDAVRAGTAEKIYIEKTFTPYKRERVLTTPAHYAYLKIADGCDNFCTYCTIPYIRGRYRSYPIEELVAEAVRLKAEGVKELILVAQDTTRYGKDLYGEYALKRLLGELLKIGFWKIRIMYAYPELVDDGLIEMIAREKGIAKYIDIPLQHVNDVVLGRMNRHTDGKEVRALIKRIEASGADIAIRSTFIVGFPGESEEDFAELEGFVRDGRINYAGFFAYSREQGTPAYKMTPRVPYKVRKKRENALSRIQCAVVEARHAEYLGKEVEVVYEGIDYVKNKFYGRTERNAPEIDTKVYFTSDFPLDVGEIYKVKITKTGFNLFGETVAEAENG